MKDLLSPLQTAIYDLLTGDSALTAIVTGVFEHVPGNQNYPYVVIGDFLSTEFRTHSRDGEQVIATLHIYDEAEGFKVSQSILDRLHTLLGDIDDLVVAGFDFIASWFLGSQTFREPDGLTRHIAVQYRIQVLDDTLRA